MFQESGSDEQLLGKTQRIVLELSTLLYFISKNSAIPLVQQYIYFLVDKKYNFTVFKENILDNLHNAVNVSTSSLLAGNVNFSGEISKQDVDDLNFLAHRVNEESTLIVLYLTIAELLPSAIVVLIFGIYSDVLGRRKFLMWLPCIGNAIYALGFLLPLYICNGDIDHPATKAIFVLAALLSGLSGNLPAFLSGNASYISDTDSPRRRTLRLAIVELTIGLTFGLANFGHGFWIKATDHFDQPLWFIFCCSILAFTMVFFFLKEPHGELLQSSSGYGQITTFRSFKGIKNLFSYSSVSRKKLLAITIAFVVYVFVQQGQERTYVLFLQSPPLYWESVQIGTFFLVTYGLSGMASWPGVPLLQRAVDDVTIIILALISKAGGSFLMAFATESFAVYLSSIVQMFHLLPYAVARSLASQQVGDDEQGAVYALIHSAQAVVGFLGPLIHNLIFAASLSWMGGFVFLASGPLLAIPVCLMLFVKYLDKKDLGYDSMDEGSMTKPITSGFQTPMSEATPSEQSQQNLTGTSAYQRHTEEVDEYSQE